MKKLLLILFCLPVIGLGQITIQETKSKKNINFPFDYSIGTGLIIQTGVDNLDGFTQFISELQDNDFNFTIFYFKYNINYNISLNNNFDFYNQLSLSIKHRNKKEFMQDEFQVSFPSYILTKFYYSGGLTMIISKKLEQSLGVTITLIPLYTNGESFSLTYNNGQTWEPQVETGFSGYWGGFNYELDYLISDKLCSTISLGRITEEGPFPNKNEELKNSVQQNDWITEILFGITYKL